MAEHDHNQGIDNATHSFDQGYWTEHWATRRGGPDPESAGGPNPHLVREVQGLKPGTALDAGCGAGAEVIWLAQQGWQVTGLDISSEALEVAAERAAEASVSSKIDWVEADLTKWRPEEPFDLVVTHYAHATLPQLGLYERLSRWVAPGGTLFIVNHLPNSATAHSGEHAPGHATTTPDDVVAILSEPEWTIDVARADVRDVGTVQLHDVIVRARRSG
ncbi:2-polyprenyl-3-methyl-5-hydroxy-6-metoxy-1,4-benzoquinol methylase [Okibacterium sp. HSC-33S16]|uniref:class I SAM-dependent methyltransferase n=1 Tax=Okibacterium sp. HSC-33S16 TaxID=2910965 RepID=UPI00209FD4A5|nr:class I SAM-dependent methyltransferase [Okibacterium sp. HSC-33S16]MCP2032492.1 2-polyprenyl-3-methyl-5-hydroxy-6-metoxy-1,4-benzoquinol methylase [Okibacterium sp. HSC-33S16]